MELNISFTRLRMLGCAVAFAVVFANSSHGQFTEIKAKEGADATQQALDWVSIGWDVHESNSKCSDCHVSKPDAEATPQLSWEVRYLNVISDRGVLVGDYRVGNLQDPILRGHLRLKDSPALVVWSAPENTDSLLDGDVLLKINGKAVGGAVAFKKRIAGIEEKSVELECIRAGEKVQLTLDRNALTDKPNPKIFKIGVKVEQPTAALRSQLQLYANEGILVTEIVGESPAAKAGVKQHDILLRADSLRLTAFEDLDAAVQASKGAPMKIVVLRGGKESAVLVQPIAMPEPEFSPVCPGLTVDSYINILGQDG